MTTFGQSYWIAGLLLWFFGTIPAYSVSQKVVGRKLESLGIQINGKDQRLSVSDELELIRGDELILQYALLEGSGDSPEIVDFVGFRLGKSRIVDDLDRVIDTSRLRRVKGRPVTRFQIRTRSGKEEHGIIPVSIREPELTEMILKINGKSRPVLAGQILSLQSSDHIEVESLRTTLPKIDKELRVAMEPVTSPLTGIEIKLFYRTYAFASVKVLLHPGSE